MAYERYSHPLGVRWCTDTDTHHAQLSVIYRGGGVLWRSVINLSHMLFRIPHVSKCVSQSVRVLFVLVFLHYECLQNLSFILSARGNKTWMVHIWICTHEESSLQTVLFRVPHLSSRRFLTHNRAVMDGIVTEGKITRWVIKVKAGEKRKWEGLKLKETERSRVERTQISDARRDKGFTQRSAGACYQSSIHFS